MSNKSQSPHISLRNTIGFMMASHSLSRAYLQQFPAQNAKDGTNKFCVSFDDANAFLVWKQETGSQHFLTYLMVDMDQVEAEDLVKASSNLMELPCGCDQEHSPLPSLKQILGSHECEPISGVWHDPNECNSQISPATTSPVNHTTAMDTFIYTPTAQNVFPIVTEGVSMTRISTMASTAYSREAAAAVSPMGKVIYSTRFEYPPSTDLAYKAIAPPVSYTALSRNSFTDTVEPTSPYTVSVSPTGAPYQTYYRIIPQMPRPRLSTAAPPLRTNHPLMSTSASTGDVADKDHKYTLIRWQGDYDEIEFEG
ncbi:hypothetical protein CHU98_g5654 [Xylaria longipes]|nr:hypothetical protein CHU98_g5654 [Xylaria longipes]